MVEARNPLQDRVQELYDEIRKLRSEHYEPVWFGTQYERHGWERLFDDVYLKIYRKEDQIMVCCPTFLSEPVIL